MILTQAAALALLGLYCGSHLAMSLVSQSWWRLPPGIRARAAGSLHRFHPRVRAALGLLALATSAPQAGPLAGWLVVSLLAASLAATLPALPLESRLVAQYYEAAGVERDREFIELQVRWDRWHAVRLGLSTAALVLAVITAS